MTHPIVVVGSGFAGTILARALHARGKNVLLVERDVHPRFALGESSTPLASISLERLAATYDLPDLLSLAAYERWNRELPDVGHGLKRGFTFYAHRRGERFANGPENDARLLVAASPDDEIADSHWVRANVDHHLVKMALKEGVPFFDDCRVDQAEAVAGGWRLSAVRGGAPLSIDASFVVDAGGGGVFLPTVRRRPSRAGPVGTGLLFGHFTGVDSFRTHAPAASFADAPFPEERAAVHHLLEEGWMYVLPFDDGRVSAGFVIDRSHGDASRLLSANPSTAWRELLSRYPSLAGQFAEARPAGQVRSRGTIQRHAGPPAGDTWARLPHAFHFSSPMFSTGIAWSLTGVERLADILGADGAPDPWRLEGYGRLLETEATYLDDLVGPAYLYRTSFNRFEAWTYLYFAAASYGEIRQRLCDPPGSEGWAGPGFLGSCDPEIRGAARQARRTLDDASFPRDNAETAATVARLLVRRNVVGLGDPARRRLYPVDFSDLTRNARLLGLAPSEVRARRLRLRGPSSSASG